MNPYKRGVWGIPVKGGRAEYLPCGIKTAK
jgi:hypothetical protein